MSKTIKQKRWWEKFFSHKKRKKKVKDDFFSPLEKLNNSGKYLAHLSYVETDEKGNDCIKTFNCAYDYDFKNIKTSVFSFNEYFANKSTMAEDLDATDKETNGNFDDPNQGKLF